MEPALKLEYYEGERITRIPISAKRRRRKRIPIPALICFTAVLFVICALFYIHQQVVTMQLNVQSALLKEQLASLRQEHEHLKLALEETTRLSTIEALARHELGMVDPTGTEMLVMNSKPYSEPTGEGWIGSVPNQHENIFTTVANWLNQLLPVGGVEAGRIGR